MPLIQEVRGYSGFDLSINDGTDGYIFKKQSTQNPERLQRQCEKQRMFRQYIQITPLSFVFNVPRVIDAQMDDGMFSFTMPYIHGSDIIEVLETSGIHQVNAIVDDIMFFLNTLLDRADMQPFNPEPFYTKLEWIQEKTQDDTAITSLISYQTEVLESLHDTRCPMGVCHGDLTMSNMIFSDKIVLIDFHDPFMETPLQDIGKLWQEIDLEWSAVMSSCIYDAAKVSIGYQYLRQLCNQGIHRLLNLYDINPAVAYAYRLMTLIRLFAYVDTREMYTRVYNKCMELKEYGEKNLNITSRR